MKKKIWGTQNRDFYCGKNPLRLSLTDRVQSQVECEIKGDYHGHLRNSVNFVRSRAEVDRGLNVRRSV